MTTVVAYDLGRTSCRAALVVDDERADVATEMTEATVIDRHGVEEVVAMLRRLAERLGAPTVQGVALGLTGAQQAPRVVEVLREVLTEAHGSTRTVVTSDVTIAHAGALGGRPGVVVLAGTGAATLGISPAGERVHVDGWGYLLGDAGSGFRIGQAALASALAHRDGRGPPTSLVARAEDRFGPLAELASLVHGAANPPRLVASFTDAVADAARAGDEVARDIWSRAAEDLARSAAAAVRRLEELRARSDASSSVPVSWAGGLMANRDLLLGPLRRELERLAPTAALTPPEGDPLHGAALLARDGRTCHEPTLHHGPLVADRPTDESRPGHHVVPQMGEG